MKHAAIINKKVCIASLLDSHQIGGSAKVVTQNFNHLPADLSAFIIIFKRNNGPPSELEIYLQTRKIDYKVIKENGSFDIKAIRQLIGVLSEGKVDLIESNHYKTHMLALIASKWLRLPWIAVSHGWTAENWKVRLYNLIDQFTLPLASVNIATGPSIAAKLRRILPTWQRPRCLPTAFDPNEFSESTQEANLRDELAIENSDFVFGAIGRLSFEKGFDYLVTAGYKLFQQEKNFKIVLVGSGTEQSKLFAQCQKLGLEKHVIFAGQKSATEISAYYKIFDCLVISSRSEGMPNVLLEAAHFKLAVIAAKVGGIPNMMNGPLTNMLFESGDVEKLADLMSAMIKKTESEREQLGWQLNDRLNRDYLSVKRTSKIYRLYRAVYRKFQAE